MHRVRTGLRFHVADARQTVSQSLLARMIKPQGMIRALWFPNFVAYAHPILGETQRHLLEHSVVLC